MKLRVKKGILNKIDWLSVSLCGSEQHPDFIWPEWNRTLFYIIANTCLYPTTSCQNWHLSLSSLFQKFSLMIKQKKNPTQDMWRKEISFHLFYFLSEKFNPTPSEFMFLFFRRKTNLVSPLNHWTHFIQMSHKKNSPKPPSFVFRQQSQNKSSTHRVRGENTVYLYCLLRMPGSTSLFSRFTSLLLLPSKQWSLEIIFTLCPWHQTDLCRRQGLWAAVNVFCGEMLPLYF